MLQKRILGRGLMGSFMTGCFMMVAVSSTPDLLNAPILLAAEQGELQSELVEYPSEDATMESFVAFDPSKKGPRPGILVVPDWMGMSPFAKDRAVTLAKQGYVAMAVDVYGKGVRPKNQDEAAKLAGKYKDNRNLLRARMRAAYDQLVSMKQVDPKKVVVMGYCFGGTAALELARSGAPLVGTATFHGGLSNPTPEDAKKIKGRVLVMHGADDPYVPPKEVEAFKSEMKAANVKMDFIAYPGAVHAFAVPTAGNDKSKGAAYNADADKKSWAAFQKFLKEVI